MAMVRADSDALKQENADVRSVLPVVRHELAAVRVASATLHGIADPRIAALLHATAG